MPIYEFKCSQCGKISEVIVMGKESDEPAQCRFCGSGKLDKVLSAPGGVRVQGRGMSGSAGEGACCGQTSPCDNPKRCCTK